MAFETLILEREESFAVITLNRPPANAISETLIRELNAALSSVQTDDTRARGDHHRQRRPDLLRRAPTSARRSPAATSRRSSASATA